MSVVQELENSIDIVDLVQRYVKLKKSGVNYKAVCPFPWHNEKTPSFMVSPSKQIAYCFGCHRWWGPLKFIMDIENCDFKEAIQILWNISGIKVNNNIDNKRFGESKTLYSIYKDVTIFYKKSLEKTPEIKKYLMDRGLNEDLIKELEFGYSDSWIELYNFLKEKWYDDKIIWESQIFHDLNSKKDKFIWRVIFPIQNIRGDYVAFAWRIVWAWEPKYLNSPATSIYDKSNILYWLFKAKSEIVKKDFVIIVEGYMDAIALYNYWIKNVVAVSWTALTEKHLVLIKRLTHKIYLCFDNDSAWEKATKLAIENLKNKDLEVKIIILTAWKDPDDFIKSGWDFEELVKNALSPIWFLIEKTKFNENSIDEKRKFLLELLEVLKNYDNEVEKDFYLKEISKKLNIREDSVYEAFNRIRFKKTFWENVKINKQEYSSEDYAIWYILLNIENLDYLKQNIIFTEFVWEDLKKFIEFREKYLDQISLEKKERFRWISLKIDSEDNKKTNDVVWNLLEKLCKKINLDSFKIAIKNLKEKMSKWDLEAFAKYDEILKKAREKGIK